MFKRSLTLFLPFHQRKSADNSKLPMLKWWSQYRNCFRFQIIWKRICPAIAEPFASEAVTIETTMCLTSSHSSKPNTKVICRQSIRKTLQSCHSRLERVAYRKEFSCPMRIVWQIYAKLSRPISVDMRLRKSVAIATSCLFRHSFTSTVLTEFWIWPCAVGAISSVYRNSHRKIILNHWSSKCFSLSVNHFA